MMKKVFDTISRERALVPYKDLNDDDVISVRLIKKNITELPPTTPKLTECDDAISREDVLDVLFDYWYKQNIVGCSGIDVYKECAVMIKQLPSVTPKPTECDDAISREELLKAIDTWDKFGCDADTKLVPYKDHYIPYIHYDDVVKAIKGMPSVTPSRRNGHWIKYGKLWKCSECEDLSCCHENYCNNCGAEMESEE